MAAIKSADENLGVVLSAVDKHNARATTDVFVVSDHGFSTIRRSIDLRKILNQAGFTAMTECNREPKPGNIILAGNGGSVLFYVIGNNSTVTRRLVAFLQQLFRGATKLVVGSDKALAPILERFTNVTMLDSSTITLPPW